MFIRQTDTARQIWTWRDSLQVVKMLRTWKLQNMLLGICIKP